MQVRRLGAFLLAICALGVATAPSQAQHIASQQVVIEVLPITRLQVSGSPGRLVLDQADAPDAAATDRSTYYDLSTNVRDVKIAAAIDAPMPPGTHLLIRLDSGLGNSVGPVNISDALAGRDVVTHIASGTDRQQRITYTFQAEPTVPALSAKTRVVTFTITE